ncbi:MAG: hypothetical protein K5871_03485 [Lachnospiraceae bacterium]|nr:hypothetical protein [Lachnospiraceae bacterium]
MDGMDSYDEGMDYSESTESFDEGFSDSLDVDVSSTMDSVEPMEESLDFAEEDISLDQPEYVDSVMDSVESEDLVFDDEPEVSEMLSEEHEGGFEEMDASSESSENAFEQAEYPETEYAEDEDVKILTRDPNELWESGNAAIEQNLEVMRDDLRDNGIEDGEEMEAMIAQERINLQQELSANIDGDLSYSYDGPAWHKDPGMLDGLSSGEAADVPEGAELAEEISEAGDLPEAAEGGIEDMMDSAEAPENIEFAEEISETGEVPEETGSEIDNIMDSVETSEELEFEDDAEVSEVAQEMPEAEEVPEVSQEMPEAAEVPEVAQEMPEAEEVPEVSQEIPEAEEVPEVSQEIPEAEEKPESSVEWNDDGSITIGELHDPEEATEWAEGETVDIDHSGDVPQEFDDSNVEQTDAIQEVAENTEPDPESALNNMTEYMNSHNYGPEDYETYSQDPEWQALNHDLQVANGIDIDSSGNLDSVDAETPERVFDDFEQSVLEDNPEFYETGSFYTQGVNSRGFEGTCGPTSQANAVNKLLGTNELTENKVLDIAVENNLCNVEGPPEGCGGTTTEQFMELYGKLNEQLGDKFNTELYEFDNVLDANQVAERLEAGDVINVAVDSQTLWGQKDVYDLLGVRREVVSDHWITVTGVDKAETGEIQGFDIIDSGGGESYVSLDKYNEMCYGNGTRIVKDPTCIVLSKK